MRASSAIMSRKLNEQVRRFLGKRAFDAETFMDYKLACAAVMLERWRRFDPAKGIQFATFAHHDVKNALLRARMLEEAGSFASLDEYKEVRRMGALMYGATQREASLRVRKKARLLGGGRGKVFENCPAHAERVASTGERRRGGLQLGLRRRAVGRRPCAKKVREAFAKLSCREQTLLEKRSAICMTCGRVSPLSERASFEDLAIKFEASSPRTAERAYRRAVEKLTLNLVGLDVLHAVRIERTAPGTYRYQADNDGDWGEFQFDATTGELQITSLAELDTTKTHRFAEQAARYLRLHVGEKLPKTVLVAFE